MLAPPDATPSELPGRSTGRSADIDFSAVFDRYFVEVHRYVARRLGSDVADDVASATFLTAFRLRDRYEESRGDQRAWLYGIASNIIRRHRRSEVRRYRAMHRLEQPSAVVGYEDSVIDQVSAADARGQLAGALATLSEGDRDVLLLIALADLTYEQVAQALGISYGTVCSRLHRARHKVRAALGANPIALDEESYRG